VLFIIFSETIFSRLQKFVEEILKNLIWLLPY